MPTFVSWNTQSARPSGAGLDRLLAALDRFADADVLCLQEVASGFRAQDGAPAVDCFAALAARLPGWQLAAFAPLDRRSREGERRRLGTMICSRYPMLQVLRHSLPWPADPDQPSLPRGALEVTLDVPGGPLRLLSVHLEYFSLLQRMAQVERLRGLHAEDPGAGLPFTFDYAFVTAGLGDRIGQLHVDGAETGSDHQPLVLKLDQGPAPEDATASQPSG